MIAVAVHSSYHTLTCAVTRLVDYPLAFIKNAPAVKVDHISNNETGCCLVCTDIDLYIY